MQSPPKPTGDINGKPVPLADVRYFITPTRFPRDMWYKAIAVLGLLASTAREINGVCAAMAENYRGMGWRDRACCPNGRRPKGRAARLKRALQSSLRDSNGLGGRVPKVETLGYSQMSLRDREGMRFGQHAPGTAPEWNGAPACSRLSACPARRRPLNSLGGKSGCISHVNCTRPLARRLPPWAAHHSYPRALRARTPFTSLPLSRNGTALGISSLNAPGRQVPADLIGTGVWLRHFLAGGEHTACRRMPGGGLAEALVSNRTKPVKRRREEEPSVTTFDDF